MDQDTFTKLPSLGILAPVAICMLIWGWFGFMAVYLAVLVAVLVGWTGYWAVARICLAVRLRHLHAQRQTTRRAAHPAPARPRLATAAA